MPASPSISPINPDHFAQQLLINNGQKSGCLFRQPNHSLTSLFQAKQDRALIKQGYTPLNLKEIIDIGDKFKLQLSSHRQVNELITKFREMGEHKIANEQKRFFLVRLVCKVWDCIVNFFQWRGLKSTATLSTQLSCWLDKNKKIAAPSVTFHFSVPFLPNQPPQTMTPRPHYPSSELLQPNYYQYNPFAYTQLDENLINEILEELRIKREQWREHELIPYDPMIAADLYKIKALDLYKTGYADTTTKEFLFKGIKYISRREAKEQNNDVPPDPTSTLFGVINTVIGQPIETRIILDEKTRQVITDVIKNSDAECCEKIIDWVSNEPAFPLELMKGIFGAIEERKKQNLEISTSSIQNLMELYVDNKWNLQEDYDDDQPVLPSNNPLVVEMSSILLTQTEDPAKTIELVKWMIKQDEFDLETCKRWLKDMWEVEDAPDSIDEDVWKPVLHILLPHLLKNKPLWFEELKKLKDENGETHEAAKALIKYQTGVQRKKEILGVLTLPQAIVTKIDSPRTNSPRHRLDSPKHKIDSPRKPFTPRKPYSPRKPLECTQFTQNSESLKQQPLSQFVHKTLVKPIEKEIPYIKREIKNDVLAIGEAVADPTKAIVKEVKKQAGNFFNNLVQAAGVVKDMITLKTDLPPQEGPSIRMSRTYSKDVTIEKLRDTGDCEPFQWRNLLNEIRILNDESVTLSDKDKADLGNDPAISLTGLLKEVTKAQKNKDINWNDPTVVKITNRYVDRSFTEGLKAIRLIKQYNPTPDKYLLRHYPQLKELI